MKRVSGESVRKSELCSLIKELKEMYGRTEKHKVGVRLAFGQTIIALERIEKNCVVFPKKDLEREIDEIVKRRVKCDVMRTDEDKVSKVVFSKIQNYLESLRDGRLLGQNTPKKTVAVPEKKEVKNCE